MYTNAAINIVIEFFAIAILAIIMASMLLDKSKGLSLNRSFIRILGCYLVVLSFDIVSWALDGNPNPQVFYMLMISNFCVYVFSVLAAAIYHHYIITYISTKTNISPKSVTMINLLCWTQLLLLVLSQFNHMFYYIDEANRYHRGDMFLIAYLVPAIISVIQIFVVLRHRNKLGIGDTLALLSYNIILFTGVALQSSLNLIMLLYAFVPIGLLIVYIRIQVEQSKRLESELTDARVDIMLSQIQPHFLYNTLATIEALCNKDKNMTTAKLVRDFANYLRENMDSLTQKELVGFSRELEHIKIYLDIEKLRLMERLTVVYDLKVTDFRLPILTIQPLVENAVRYGVSKKRYGGAVTISTCPVPEGVKVIIADDGAGFESAISVQQGEHRSVGIENVRERLRAQCGGLLTIESEKDKGTVCTVIIPQGGYKL